MDVPTDLTIEHPLARFECVVPIQLSVAGKIVGESRESICAHDKLARTATDFIIANYERGLELQELEAHHLQFRDHHQEALHSTNNSFACVSLVNAGNCLYYEGKAVESIRCYDRAIELVGIYSNSDEKVKQAINRNRNASLNYQSAASHLPGSKHQPVLMARTTTAGNFITWLFVESEEAIVTPGFAGVSTCFGDDTFDSAAPPVQGKQTFGGNVQR